MKFYNIETKKPKLGQKVLVKFLYDYEYAICYYGSYQGKIIFKTNNWTIDACDACWMPIEELDKIEVE